MRARSVFEQLHFPIDKWTSKRILHQTIHDFQVYRSLLHHTSLQKQSRVYSHHFLNDFDEFHVTIDFHLPNPNLMKVILPIDHVDCPL